MDAFASEVIRTNAPPHVHRSSRTNAPPHVHRSRITNSWSTLCHPSHPRPGNSMSCPRMRDNSQTGLACPPPLSLPTPSPPPNRWPDQFFQTRRYQLLVSPTTTCRQLQEIPNERTGHQEAPNRRPLHTMIRKHQSEGTEEAPKRHRRSTELKGGR